MQYFDLRLTLLQDSLQVSAVGLRPSRDPRIQLRAYQHSSLSERLAGNLLYLIATGRLSPGASLPAERSIAEAVGVSRVCVRNALDRLKAQGYLQSVQGSGTRVVPPGDDASPLGLLLSANSDNLHDLAEIRGYLEVWAASRAAQYASDEQILGLRALVDEAAHLGEAERGENDLIFHSAISRASKCVIYEYLSQLISRTLRAYFLQLRYTFFVSQTTSDELVRHHALICESIERRDAAAAARSMAEHSRMVRKIYQENHESVSRLSRWRDNTLCTSKEETLKLLAETAREQLPDQVANSLIALLASGRLSQGERLPSERELADRMGVSRVSIRVALTRLKELGFVESTHRSGTRVLALPTTRPTIETVVKASPNNLLDLCEIRGYLEVWAARRAAQYATTKEREELRQIVREMHHQRASDRLKAHNDLRFHLLIAQASGSAVYSHLMLMLQDVLADFFEYFRNHLDAGEEQDRLALEQHVAIQEAICRGDADAAAEKMHEHSHMYQEAYRRNVPNAPSPPPTEFQL